MRDFSAGWDSSVGAPAVGKLTADIGAITWGKCGTPERRTQGSPRDLGAGSHVHRCFRFGVSSRLGIWVWVDGAGSLFLRKNLGAGGWSGKFISPRGFGCGWLGREVYFLAGISLRVVGAGSLHSVTFPGEV